MRRADCRNVAADNDRWTGREAVEQMLHALPQIAVALRDARRSWRTPEVLSDVVVRRDGKQGLPARIGSKPQDGVGQAIAIEADRSRPTDLAAEPPLGDAQDWALGHDDETGSIGGALARPWPSHRGAQAPWAAREDNRAACSRDCAWRARHSPRAGSARRS